MQPSLLQCLRRRGAKRSLAGLASLGAAVGCYPPDNGRSPPIDRIYFPVGIVLSPEPTPLASVATSSSDEPRWMYVANSDFDLQFNAGTLQAYDLAALRKIVPRYCNADSECNSGEVCDLTVSAANQSPSHWCVDAKNPLPCGTLGVQSASDALLTPGRCNFVDPAPLLADSVFIGAFATDVVYSRAPTENGAAPSHPGRLFLPVRGDATVNWLDVDDVASTPSPNAGLLHCGQGADRTCDADHRRGKEPIEENSRGAVLPPEPFGIAVDDQGQAIVTTHQTSGEVALFVNHWVPEDGAPIGPELQDVATNSPNALPQGTLDVAAIPQPALVKSDPSIGYVAPAIPYQPGFLLTYRNAAQVQLLRYFDYAAASPQGPVFDRPFLDVARSTTIGTNSQGTDSTGIAIDGNARATCEATCRANAGVPASLADGGTESRWRAFRWRHRA